jgi:thiamine-phosphate diphosphorylase
VLLTDRRQARRPLVEVVEAAACGGVRRVVLREKDMDPGERAALAAALRAVLADAGGQLIVAGADPLGGGAVHLAAAGPYPPPDLPLVGRSCHDEAELSRLSTEHYAMVSPVFPTPSKPGYGPPLGLDGLARLAARSPVPVLALGGITPDNAAGCLAAGAAGVAVMGAVMRADDPAAVVCDLRGATLSVKTPAGGGGVWS